MPLLLLRRMMMIGLMAWLLSACSSHSDLPSFTASGYIADRGVMRLWREDDSAQQSVNLISVYSPFRGADTVVTRYEFLQDEVRLIHRSQQGLHPEIIQIRFDEQGNPSFMQRQRDNQREKLSHDELALYQFEARRLLDVSQSLRVGRVRLVQGQWRNGVLKTCAGQQVSPDFERRASAWITSRSYHSTGQLGIAWLQAPEGTQLLLVANEDFCHWQPTKKDL